MDVSDIPTIHLYPNPVSDILYIDTQEDIQNIAVLDLSGKICLLSDFIPNMNHIFSMDLSQLQKGVYFLYIQNNGINKQFKFLKN